MNTPERWKNEADDLLVFVIKHMDKQPEFVSKFVEEHLRKAYYEGQLSGYKEGRLVPNEWSDK